MKKANLKFLVIATSLDSNYIYILDKKWNIEVKCLETGEIRTFTVTRFACDFKAPHLIDVIHSFQSCMNWSDIEAIA